MPAAASRLPIPPVYVSLTDGVYLLMPLAYFRRGRVRLPLLIRADCREILMSGMISRRVPFSMTSEAAALYKDEVQLIMLRDCRYFAADALHLIASRHKGEMMIYFTSFGRLQLMSYC